MPPFFQEWMNATFPEADHHDLRILQERDGAREAVQRAIRETALDHLVGLDVIERMGDFPETVSFIRNRLPTQRRVMSGDLGEILATEYVNQYTDFRVPLKRLRWKDDRNTAMRGNDGLAHRRTNDTDSFLKVESKSRANLSTTVVAAAVADLQKHSGRPNPSSLAFISGRLRELGRDDEAIVFERIQRRPPRRSQVEHLVFTFSGNDPTAALQAHRHTGQGGNRRSLVGCIVPDHQAFIRSTFENLNAPVD